jgi:hypothetical protein
VHPRDGVMLVKGKALLTLAEHEEYGKMTSHQILVVLTKKFKQALKWSNREDPRHVWDRR